MALQAAATSADAETRVDAVLSAAESVLRRLHPSQGLENDDLTQFYIDIDAIALVPTVVSDAQRKRVLELLIQAETAKQTMIRTSEERLILPTEHLTETERLKLHHDLALAHFNTSRSRSRADEEQFRLYDRSLHHVRTGLTIASTTGIPAVNLQRLLPQILLDLFHISGLKKDADACEESSLRLLAVEPANILAQLHLSQLLIVMYNYLLDSALLERASRIVDNAFAQAVEEESLEWIRPALAVQAVALRATARAYGRSADFDEAIEKCRTAMAMTEDKNSNMFRLLTSEILLDRFENGEAQVDLDDAFDLLKPTLSDKTFSSARGRATILHGRLMLAKYDYGGNVDDLDSAFRDLVKVFVTFEFKMDPESAEFSNQASSNNTLLLECLLLVCRMLRRRTQLSGTSVSRLWLLHVAHRAKRIAINIAKSWGNSYSLVPCWLQLSNLLMARNASAGSLSALHAATKFASSSITALGTHRGPLFVECVAARLEVHRSNEGELVAQEMIKLVKETLHSVWPLEKSKRTDFLHQVIHFVVDRYPECSVDKWKRAVDSFHNMWRLAKTRNLMAYVAYLHCCCAYLASIAYTTGARVDFDLAISNVRFLKSEAHKTAYGQRALAYPMELPRLLAWRFFHFHDEADGREALELLQARVGSTGVDAATRMDDYTKIICIQIRLKNSQNLIHDSLTGAVDMSEYALGEGLQQSDALQLVRELGQQSELRALFALNAGLSVQEAFVFLESGRSIIWDRLLNNDISLERIEKLDAVLAAEFRAHRQGKQAYLYRVSQIKPQDRFIWVDTYLGLLRKIRQLPGLQGFMRPTDLIANLQQHTGGAPLVAVVDHTGEDSRSLIFTGSGFDCITFDLRLDQLFEKYAPALRTAIEVLGHWSESAPTETVEKASKVFNKFLEILWQRVARPVLDKLGFLGATSHPKELPRIYWLCSGWLNVVPIHVAGTNIGDANEDSVHSRCVSSYVTGIRALSYLIDRVDKIRRVQQKRSANGVSKKRALVLGLENTPGMITQLVNAPKECNVVSEALQNEYQIIDDSVIEPDAAPIMSQLKTCDLVHLAMHGSTSTIDPFESSICTRDWLAVKPPPLRVGTLMHMKLETCELAFLSLCDSAAISDTKIRNEGLHITGAMHMAGVPSVISTWFPLSDKYAVEVAREFYKALKHEETGRLDVARSARALHKVITGLKQSGVNAWVWGTWAHFGV